MHRTRAPFPGEGSFALHDHPETAPLCGEQWYPEPTPGEKWAVRLGKALAYTHVSLASLHLSVWAGGGEQTTIDLPGAIRQTRIWWEDVKVWAVENPWLFVAILATLVLIFGKVSIGLGRRRGPR
jgi:hypothetical protein